MLMLFSRLFMHEKKTFSLTDLSDNDLFGRKCAAELLRYKNLMIDPYPK
jgi:hypothetical protein